MVRRRARATAPAGLAALAALGAIASGAAPAERSPPACRAEPTLRPERAFVGQEIVYRLRILRRADVDELRWETGLSFPGFRAEELPGRTAGEVTVEGTPYRVYWERRALFPVRAGRLAIPPARLLCATPGGVVAAPVPGASLAVREPPVEGRPERWSGLVGEVALSRSVSPRSLELGGSVRVSVVLRGAANVWVVPSPLEGAFRESVAEVFPRPRKLARDAGEHLAFRRYWTYDVVPRRAGALEIPRLRVPYFAPEEGRYAEASAPAARVEVRPREEGAGADAPGRPPERGRPAEEGEGADLPAALLGALAALLLAAPALLVVRAARRRARERGPRRALAEADRAARADEVERERTELARALRLALEPRVAGARTRSARTPRGAPPSSSSSSTARASPERRRLRRPAGPGVRSRRSSAPSAAAARPRPGPPAPPKIADPKSFFP